MEKQGDAQNAKVENGKCCSTLENLARWMCECKVK
jgi:hypothetical protein